MNQPATEFNIGYRDAGVYQTMLPPHYYGGREDIDLVADLLAETLGPPGAAAGRRVLDLGCGPGRVTKVLAPYADTLLGTDKSAGMIDAFRTAFPEAEHRTEDTETALAALAAEGRRFDLVGAFWSMSYPLLECFEETTADGVLQTSDLDTGNRRAAAIVANLVDVIAPDGHLVMLFFDAHSPEQQLVTELWERIHPFPGTGRGYTLELLLAGLTAAQTAGVGELTTRRLPGIALAAGHHSAQQWFLTGHLNASPALVDDPEVLDRIDRFLVSHTGADGRVRIPSGVNVIHFHATQDRDHPLPRPNP